VTRVGIVGGLGPEATIDYYRRLMQVWAQHDPSTAPPLIIDSIDVQRVLRLAASDRPALAAYIAESVQRLADAGVDFAAISANTPHLVFDEVAAASPIPLISIVEVCAEEARRQRLRRPLLLGARFTMEGPFYLTVFRRSDIEIVTPEESDRAWIHDVYVNQMIQGEFRDDTRRRFVDFVAHLRDTRGIDAVILGGTELPILLRESTIAGLPALDTTALHVDAIIARLRAPSR